MLLERSSTIGTLPRMAIGEVLRGHARTAPDRLCCAVDDQRFTFAEMDARSDALAAGIAALGVRRGDRVATLTPTRIELLELYHGLAKAGAIQVPVNAFLKGEFLRHQLAHSRASVLITDASGRAAVEPLLAGLPELRAVVQLDPGAPGDLPYGELLTAGATPPDVVLGPGDPLSIIYTSGTTGLPKGCVAPHGYYCRSADIIGHGLALGPDDVVFSAMPLFHAGGRLVAVTMPLLFGIPTHFQSTFSARGFLPQARDAGATVGIAVGAMGQAILATAPGPADRDHGLTRVMCAPLSPASQVVFRERFGIDPWVDVFGQSECMPVLNTVLGSDARDPAGCGLPAPDLQVELLDDDLRPVPDGQVGEICARPLAPYTMFDGYYERDDATVEAFRGLWFHTGDYGRRLPSGALAYVDRKKDALRRRGENVSSLELEAGIAAHADIAECAVHAVPSELGEDDIKACVVLVEGARLDPPALFAFFKASLPYFAIPRYVEPVAALPRNGVGRVMKHLLRDAGHGAAVVDLEALGLVVERAERR